MCRDVPPVLCTRDKEELLKSSDISEDNGNAEMIGNTLDIAVAQVTVDRSYLRRDRTPRLLTAIYFDHKRCQDQYHTRWIEVSFRKHLKESAWQDHLHRDCEKTCHRGHGIRIQLR
jgi:hypothetical protein